MGYNAAANINDVEDLCESIRSNFQQILSVKGSLKKSILPFVQKRRGNKWTLTFIIIKETLKLGTSNFLVVQSLSQVWHLQPQGLQQARLPCPPPSPGVCPNSCPLNQWCHPIISFSVILFPSCLQSSPARGSFPMSWLFTSDGQNIGISALASVLLMSTLGWFPLELTVFFLLAVQWLSRVFSSTSVQKHQLFGAQPSL